MENEAKNSNSGLITLIIVLFVLVIGLVSYIACDKLINKEKDNNTNIVDDYNSIREDAKNIIINTNNTINNNTNNLNDNNSNNYEDLIKNAKVSYEDSNYISYEVQNNSMCSAEKYIVFDKKNNKYLNDTLGEESIISYFGNVNGEYYYFIEYLVDSRYAATKIYRDNWILVKDIDRSYNSYNSETKTFIFTPCPGAVVTDNYEYEWNPTN